MADSLKAGTHSQKTDSMAQAMVDAFRAEWPNFNPDGKPDPFGASGDPKNAEPLRLFFVAVSQGLLRYLKDNPTAFQVDVTNSADSTLDGEVTELRTTGTLH